MNELNLENVAEREINFVKVRKRSYWFFAFSSWLSLSIISTVFPCVFLGFFGEMLFGIKELHEFLLVFSLCNLLFSALFSYFL